MIIIAQKAARLDKTLQEVLNQPRNQVEHFIREVGVDIDGKEIHKCGLKLKGGEKITITFPQMEASVPQEIDFDIDIIYEDEDVLVLNKPPFLIIHPAASVKEPTLVDWLKHRGITLSTISGEERNGIVHRIDKETSGAIIIAKNNEAHQALSKQLEDRTMGRYYLAIIDLPLKEDLIVDKPIGRHNKHRIKMAIKEQGRASKSAFAKLALSQKRGYELIAAKLFTGRTHQIRVHLESLSRHILADELYGFKSKKDTIPRVMLHARIIYFNHPRTGELIVKEAPLFKDFETILKDEFNQEEIDEKINRDYIIGRFNHTL
jgi:23S rRNA pseudouridine1911/1915/1917 synthase